MRVQSITKEEQVRNILLERIGSGLYAENEKIKSIRDLAGEFQVSKLTIQQAISNLTLQKILRSEHGRGTFVVPRHEQSAGNKLVGVLMNTTGDLNAPLSNSVLQQLQSLGYYPVVLDTSNHTEDPAELPRRLGELINSDPCGIIVNGMSDMDSSEILNLLDRVKNVAIVLSQNPKYKGDALQVVSDYAWGHYIGVKHLLELGHRNILIIPTSSILYSRVIEALRGCQRAFEEFGVEWDFDKRFIGTGNEQDDMDKMVKLLSCKNRPTAVFASMDYSAVKIYRAAAKAGLKIPDDLSVVGYFNTHWAEQLEPKLTSVSVKETEIGRTVVDELFGSNGSGKKKIIFKPELIVRNSTAFLKK